jgi:hypothetical protein
MRYLIGWLMLAAAALATPQGASGDAKVLEVQASGRAGAYTFAVRVQSPDQGCERYADWWEVVSADGTKLIYRRILLHSHVSEQPFTRSGGPVQIGPDTVVVVRVHVHPLGYARAALRGSVAGGFEPVLLPPGFGAALETTGPLPTSCWF